MDTHTPRNADYVHGRRATSEPRPFHLVRSAIELTRVRGPTEAEKDHRLALCILRLRFAFRVSFCACALRFALRFALCVFALGVGLEVGNDNHVYGSLLCV